MSHKIRVLDSAKIFDTLQKPGSFFPKRKPRWGIHLEVGAARNRLELLGSKLALVPQSPGVYIHKDAQGKILYVGKAKNLQSRLRSYFTGFDRHTPKTRALVSKIQDFEVMVVDNENESLILENNLIKHNKPPYNILLRDDKTYPYLKITTDEKWPRLLQTRRRKNDAAFYFGPYSNGNDLYGVLSVINRFFPLVKCTPNVFKNVTRPCNYYDIKRCLGPCHLPVNPLEYQKILDNIVSILLGKTHDVVTKLKVQMRTESKNENYEHAALLRDQIKALDNLPGKQSVVLQPGLNLDIVCSFWHPEKVSFYVALLRDGKLVGGESHIIVRLVDEIEDASAAERERLAHENTVSAFLCQFYATREIPSIICVPEGDEFLNIQTKDSVTHFISEIKRDKLESQNSSVGFIWNNKLPIEKDHKGKQEKLLREAFLGLCKTTWDNAKNQMQERLKVDEKNQTLMLGLQNVLKLERMPAWIECYDISTFQGAETVASGVVFRDGKPCKAEYRKYIIKTVVGQDDFGSLREVIRRRFKDERRTQIPDVLLVDGGEPQVREVGWVLKSLGLDGIAFVGIAKSRTARNFHSSELQVSQERLVIPHRVLGELMPDAPPETYPLSQSSPEFRLVTQLRDEAHRFAITFHRSLRDKTTVKSILQTVPGLGPTRRKKLLNAFGSFAGIRAATAEDIASKANLPLKLAIKIKGVCSENCT